MNNQPSSSYELAVRDFHRARKSAILRQMLARLRGQSTELMNYETISQQLHPKDLPIRRGMAEIPLKKIVGSVGRYRDFTREFLPTLQADESRWANVKAAITDMTGMPPIEVYQIGDAYFVLDGNHRVSVARKLGVETISAHVTEIQTRVPLSADDNPDEVICKAGYANFLKETNLDERISDIDMMMTVAGHYLTLIKQIDLQHKKMVRDSLTQPTWQDAAVDWYKSVYLPVINIMRNLGVMQYFPQRTETDIYVLLSERREELERILGWHLELSEALPNLVQEEAQAQDKNKQLGYISKIIGSIRPAVLTDLPVGGWRSQQMSMARESRLFADLLLLFEGIDEDWMMLENAIKVATADHDRILGLYIVDEPAQFDRTATREMVARFKRRCQSAGIVGEFALEAGDGATMLLKRSVWSDLIFINLTQPPESTVADRLRSFWGPVITRCRRPLLVAPHARFTGMSPMLLAYDGSPKAYEALFIATYNACRWGHELIVLTVETPSTKPNALVEARTYLEERGVDNATYLLQSAPIGEAIMQTATAQGCNVIIMGGFGARPVRRLLSGSVVEYVLQHTEDQSVLICQ